MSFYENSTAVSSPAEALDRYRGAQNIVNLIFMQLPFCDLDPVSLCGATESDDFALGYVFGLADMGNYLFNDVEGGQEDALEYIRHVFVEALGGGGEDSLHRALRKQSEPEFVDGRNEGARDLTNWIKSQGQITAMGLSRHFARS